MILYDNIRSCSVARVATVYQVMWMEYGTTLNLNRLNGLFYAWFILLCENWKLYNIPFVLNLSVKGSQHSKMHEVFAFTRFPRLLPAHLAHHNCDENISMNISCWYDSLSKKQKQNNSHVIPKVYHVEVHELSRDVDCSHDGRSYLTLTHSQLELLWSSYQVATAVEALTMWRRKQVVSRLNYGILGQDQCPTTEDFTHPHTHTNTHIPQT